MNGVEMQAGALWTLFIVGLGLVLIVIPFLVFVGFVIYDLFRKRKEGAK